MEPLTWILLAAVAAGVPAAWLWQKRRTPAAPAARGRQRAADHRDTVADWPPTATRVLSEPERRAFELLRQALPDHLVLAQVSLSRFIRVPTRNSYADWLNRVGHLSADLVVCDPTSQVRAVIEVRGADSSARSGQRHERMTRVLKAAGVRVLVWSDGALPLTPEAARAAVFPEEAARAAAEQAAREAAAEAARLAAPAPSPVARAGDGPRMDPPPTTWYGELEGPRTPGAGDDGHAPR